ncbi:hypothetical protein GMDG_04464 [Pseudogymnoascus destructans 20631-21]|uniref:Uncharacterized protein n=1 Tax=Pseudogymnoascus destructans (strain ATCC MYA-4855 / 20631-21) TaxID=658429 RepID=L8GBP3_PSED2|nr:hypothetical protein GMDG_04464 [Pseudogymnoascus destructans 20631-21]
MNPPPPPPHGEAPKSSGLPPGKYDIFIIPPHSSGSGFLYLPSLKPNVNSFAAGFASALILVAIVSALMPTLQLWWYSVKNTGGNGMFMVSIGLAIGAWALGRMQSDGRTGSNGGNNGGGGGGGGGAPPGGPPPHQGHQGHQNGYAPGGPPPQPSGHAPPPNPGPQPGYNPGPQQNQPPPKSSWQRSNVPPGGTNANTGGYANTGPNTGGYANTGPNTGGYTNTGPNTGGYTNTGPNTGGYPKTGPSTGGYQNPNSGANTNSNANANANAKSGWEKAREETRKREEERKVAEALRQKKEEDEKRLKEAREKEARERVARERIAREARAQREAREKREKDEQANKAEAEKVVERAAERVAAERAAAERAAAERAAAERAAAERAAAESAAAERAAAERAAAERAAAERAAAERAAAERAKPKASTYAYSAVGEKTNPWPRGQPPSPASASPRPTPPQAPPTKRPPAATARTYLGNEDDYSYRPYDKPAHKKAASSVYSASSYAASQSTARTTPPPSMRGAYSTKDPDKIVLKAVYAFNNAFMKTPTSMLVSGTGSVTDGLILRITTEGLFIDDDVRGVPQREWDVKAWTMKLVEVWCPAFSSPAPASTAASNPARKLWGNSSSKPKDNAVTNEAADALLLELLASCKAQCRLGLLGEGGGGSSPKKSSPLAERESNASSQTGQFRGGKLHVLRASIRDQEGRKYVFVIGEEESWKVAVGLQRLRKGTQVRQLGVSGMSGNDAKLTLDNLGWG